MNEKLQQENTIKAIEKAFTEMLERKEESVIVKFFPDVRELIIPDQYLCLHPKRFMECKFVNIILLREKPYKYIKIFYKEKTALKLPFQVSSERKTLFSFLKSNNILPTEQEFLEAKSLMNSSSMGELMENLVGCDN